MLLLALAIHRAGKSGPQPGQQPPDTVYGQNWPTRVPFDRTTAIRRVFVTMIPMEGNRSSYSSTVISGS